MTIFISLVIFALSVYLFFITHNKIKNIRESIIIEDSKKELEGVITEFNRAAARNIEILENKITELQEILKKANQKIIQLDEKIERMNKPIIIEKIVEKKERGKSEEKIESPYKKISRKTSPEKEHGATENKTTSLKSEQKKNELSRSEELKKLIKQGFTKKELISMGFMENEINLITFLMKKEK